MTRARVRKRTDLIFCENEDGVLDTNFDREALAHGPINDEVQSHIFNKFFCIPHSTQNEKTTTFCIPNLRTF